jgi:lysophospholipase L1-like esterase
MSKTLIVIGLFAVGVFVFVFWNTEASITNYPVQEGAIVAFGDSLLEGVGASPGRSLPTLMSESIHEPIINLGVSGDTTADGLERIEEVLAYNPRLVIVSLGGNDLIRNVPRETIYANLKQMVDTIHESGSMVLLLGVRGPLKNIDDEYERIQKETGCAYVPNILDGLIGRSGFMYDAIHPNDAGYAKIAQKIAPVLRDLLE